MNNQLFITTSRLIITSLSLADDSFILELVNTEGWIRFIGNRNVGSLNEARAYIEKIINNENISYWVVGLADSLEKIGIVTFIKRDYLDHHDIGFAILPAFSKKGYAYEATLGVLKELIKEYQLQRILATTLPANTNSIKLLQKLGFVFEKEIEIGKEKLHVYGADGDKFDGDAVASDRIV